MAWLLGCGGGGFPRGTTWSLVPQKPDHLAYLADVTDGIPVQDLMPVAVDAAWLAGLHGWSPPPLPPSPLGSMGSPAAAFDLRAEARVTPSRDPTYACGKCWTGATLGSLESSLASAALWDFSESHMQRVGGNGAFGCQGGANSDFATSYLAAWRGPVRETDYAPPPLPLSGGADPRAVVHVQDVRFLPPRGGPLDNDWIKWALWNLGGVYSSMGKHPSGTDGDARYYHPAARANHAATIVGWDDDFDRTQFLCTDPSVPEALRVPPGDGAFLVKDPLGPSKGEAGYAYVSYYDGSIGTCAVAFTAEDLGNYCRIYQHDSDGPHHYLTTRTGGASRFRWQAVAFTAAADEYLAAVGVLDVEHTMDLQVLVYLDPSGGPLHPSGPVAAVDVGTLCGGYYTVPLQQKVRLRRGQRFSIVLKGRNRMGDWPATLCIERRGTGGSREAPRRGSCWISADGLAWADLSTVVADGDPRGGPSPLSDASLCIKAFTKPMSSYQVEVPSPANGNRWVWHVVNEGPEPARLRPVAALFRRLPTGAGFERFGAEVPGVQSIDAAGVSHDLPDGWVTVGPGETVRVLAALGATEGADRIGYAVYRSDDATGVLELSDVWRHVDLDPDPLRVVSTSPASAGGAAPSGPSAVTVTFDREVRPGPGIGRIRITSSTETKVTYPCVRGNQLMIVTGTPLETPAAPEAGGGMWTATLPVDAVVDEVHGKPLAQPHTWFVPIGPVMPQHWVLRGDMSAVSPEELSGSGAARVVLVLPGGFPPDRSAEFREAFYTLVESFSHAPASSVYSERYGSRIVFVGAWVPGADLGARVLSRLGEPTFLSVDPPGVDAAVIDVRERIGAIRYPSAVVVLFDDRTETVLPGTIRARGSPYGISKLNLMHIASTQETIHELGHSLLGWADESAPSGFESDDIQALNAFSPSLEMGDEWPAGLRQPGATARYDFRVSEILGDNGADDVATTHVPARAPGSGGASVPFPEEGALAFGLGVFRASGANPMARAAAFGYAHTASQEQTLAAAFDGVTPRANDRIRTAGPTTPSTLETYPYGSWLMIFDADKHNRFHPTVHYEVQVGWYQRIYTAHGSDIAWTVAQTTVYPQVRTMSLSTAAMSNSVLGRPLLHALCQGGFQTDLDPCELYAAYPGSGGIPDTAFRLRVPYQEVPFAAPQWFTQYFWRFRSFNGATYSGFTPWSTFYHGY